MASSPMVRSSYLAEKAYELFKKNPELKFQMQRQKLATMSIKRNMFLDFRPRGKEKIATVRRTACP
jgi:hypothetical protein